MDLDELRAFLAVVDHGSVLAGADALRVARTTLRRRVESLEVKVGRALFHRAPDGMTPTATGQALAERGRMLLRDAGQLIPTLLDDTPFGARRLRLVNPPGMPAGPAAQGLLLIRQTLPGIEVELSEHPDPIACLPHAADAVLSFRRSNPDDALIGFVVMRLVVRLVATEAYLAYRGAPRTIEDLRGHDIAAWRAHGGAEPTLPLLHGGSAPLSPVFVCANVDLLRALARTSQVMALAPDGQLDLGDDPPLVPVMEQVVTGEVALWVLTPRSVSSTLIVRTALERLRDIAAQFKADGI